MQLIKMEYNTNVYENKHHNTMLISNASQNNGSGIRKLEKTVRTTLTGGRIIIKTFHSHEV